jgi:hypothetical protein
MFGAIEMNRNDVSEGDSSVPAVLHGGLVDQRDGHVHRRNLASGGVLDGSPTASLIGGSDGAQTATLDATFP